jgi:Domain of unknown function DUF11
VTCDLGTLANGATATVTLVVHVDTATPAGTIANSATVNSETSDPTSRNDSASARVSVLAAPVAERAGVVGPPVAIAVVAVPRFTG